MKVNVHFAVSPIPLTLPNQKRSKGDMIWQRVLEFQPKRIREHRTPLCAGCSFRLQRYNKMSIYATSKRLFNFKMSMF